MPGDITGLGMIGSFFASTPKVPEFKPINTTKEQGKAVAGNITNFDKTSKLAGDVNTFNQEELTRMLEMSTPGYGKTVGAIGSQINSLLSGEIPDDVMGQVERSAAYRSLSGGFGGSDMSKKLVARDLGLTSLNLIEKGIDAGTRWMATARQSNVAPQFDVSAMFITPQQRIQTEMWNREGQFQRDWMKNQIKAEYSTGTKISRGLSDMGQGLTGLITSVAGSAGGAAGGAI